MKIILNRIFKFLKENREFNIQLQKKSFHHILCNDACTSKKVIELLYHIANTQSQPKIDPLADFYRLIHNNIEKTQSFESFVKLLTGVRSSNFDDLYKGLSKQKGWGKKTAALFTKVVYQAHNTLGDRFQFWSDTPKKIEDNDEIWLPVDAVIIYIFKQIGVSNPNFDNINRLIKQHYNNDDLEVWDDLWFWGFITQKGTGIDRQLEWNENKYWSLLYSDKDPEKIDRTRDKSYEFINLIKKTL